MNQFKRLDLAIGAVLVLITVAAYWGVWDHEFVNFDDPEYVVYNPHVQRGLTSESIGWAMTATAQGNWHPLTWLSHMLDTALFGPNRDPNDPNNLAFHSGGPHAVNLALHAANAVLLFLVLRWMTAATWPSAVVAALFAVHPLHVESVAWVSERKDLLSTLLGLCSLAAYVWYVRRPSGGRYLAAAALLALGLMAKPMLVTLPCVFLLLDYWPLGRRESLGRLVVEKLPLLALSAVSCIVTYVAQQKWGAVVPVQGLPLGPRLANALFSYVRYLGKAFWPADLAVFYPFRLPGQAGGAGGRSESLSGLTIWYVIGAVVLLAAITVAAAWAARRGRRYIAVGWLWYLGMLVPVIGLVQVGAQGMADRYTYLPLVGIFILATWTIADLAAGRRWAGLLLPGIAAAGLAGCVLLTARQAAYWSDSIMLFEHALAVTEDNVAAHHNLGAAYLRKGNQQKAIEHCRAALRLDDEVADTHYNLAVALANEHQRREAIVHAREVLRLEKKWGAVPRENTGSPAPREMLARWLAEEGRTSAQAGEFGDALDYYRQALNVNNQDLEALAGLAWLRATAPEAELRDGAEAVHLAARAYNCPGQVPLDTAVRIADALAAAYAEVGRFSQAVDAATEAAALAGRLDDRDLARQIEARLQLYRHGKPYRLPGRRVLPPGERQHVPVAP